MKKNIVILLLLKDRLKKFFCKDKFNIVKENSFDVTCKNKGTIFTYSINFTGSLSNHRIEYQKCFSLLDA